MAKITLQEMTLEQAQQARDEAAQAVEKARVDLEMAEDDLLAAREAGGELVVPASLTEAMERFFQSLGTVTDFEEVGDGIYGFLYTARHRQIPISLTINVTQ